MVDEGLNTSINMHKECLKFCFMALIQKELDEVKSQWNRHRIRRVTNSQSPAGRPDVLYFTPELSGGIDYSFDVIHSELIMADDFVQDPPLLPCNKAFAIYYASIMRHQNLAMPNSAREAKTLFNILVNQ